MSRKISSTSTAFVPTSKPFVPGAAQASSSSSTSSGGGYYGSNDASAAAASAGAGQTVNPYAGANSRGSQFSPSHVRHGESYPGAHAALGYTNSGYAQHYPALGGAPEGQADGASPTGSGGYQAGTGTSHAPYPQHDVWTSHAAHGHAGGLQQHQQQTGGQAGFFMKPDMESSSHSAAGGAEPSFLRPTESGNSGGHGQGHSSQNGTFSGGNGYLQHQAQQQQAYGHAGYHGYDAGYEAGYGSNEFGNEGYGGYGHEASTGAYSSVMKPAGDNFSSVMKPASSPSADNGYQGGFLRRADSPAAPSFMKEAESSGGYVNPYGSPSADVGGGGGAGDEDSDDEEDLDGPTDAEYRELMFASMEEKAKASVVSENVGRYNSMAEFREKLLAAKREGR
eukprot:INCI20287.1.p1 GENE.INCI20287.1~~INCI20287.1.p1  ORF type:complete len:394 (+),score=61.44 INCI20287.1:235-1416(+)